MKDNTKNEESYDWARTASVLAGRLDGIFDAAIQAGGDVTKLQNSETAPEEVQRLLRQLATKLEEAHALMERQNDKLQILAKIAADMTVKAK